MSEVFKSEEEIVKSWEKRADLVKHPLSSDNFAFYEMTDFWDNLYVIGFFKDTKNEWHTLNYEHWPMVHDGIYDDKGEFDLSADEVNKRILELRKDGHIMDNEEHRIYYIKEGKLAEDTGYERDRRDRCDRRDFTDSDSEEDTGYERDQCVVNTAYLFKDSFVIDNKADAIGDPDYDVNKTENITNRLYKRQEDGSYKQIWESSDCIFQKKGFPDNVYFSGGSWVHPEMKNYFVDGQVDGAMKEKIEVAILRHVEDPLQKKQEELEKGIDLMQKIVRHKYGYLIRANKNKKEELLENFKRACVHLGKTGNSSTGEITPGQRRAAKIQSEETKKILKRKRSREK